MKVNTRLTELRKMLCTLQKMQMDLMTTTNQVWMDIDNHKDVTGKHGIALFVITHSCISDNEVESRCFALYQFLAHDYNEATIAAIKEWIESRINGLATQNDL